MTKEELAARLNGRQYGEVATPYEWSLAKENGLVIVYGASDDLMEFRGAVYDEVGAYNGGTAYFTPEGLLDEECDSECKYFRAARDRAVPVNARWNKDGYSFIYETSIPHATFEVVEGEEKYCRGIVFSLADVKLIASKPDPRA